MTHGLETRRSPHTARPCTAQTLHQVARADGPVHPSDRSTRLTHRQHHQSSDSRDTVRTEPKFEMETVTRRGLAFASSCGESPKRSITPGRKFSTKTSDCWANCRSKLSPPVVLEIKGQPLFIGIEKAEQTAPLYTWLLAKKGGNVRAPSPCPGSFNLHTSAP